MDSGIICWLKHYASVSCVHLINGQRSVSSSITATALLSHSISHKECLIWFLRSKHSVDSLCWRLTLSAPKILIVLMNESICERTISHSMLIHTILLKVWHHVCKSCLCSWFCSFLLDFVHLLQVLFGRRIQLGAETLLGLERTSFWFWHLVHFETTSHRRVHHYFARSLDLLQRVQSDVVQITGAVQVSLLVSHDLLKKVISYRFTLFPFQQ